MGGVNKTFYQFPGKYAEFDSWLSECTSHCSYKSCPSVCLPDGRAGTLAAVGMTGAESTNSLGSVGVDFAHWDETHGLHTTDGAVFW
jgi:hypothetical protein